MTNLTSEKEKNYDDIMLENYDVIAIFFILDQLGANRKPNSGRIVYKTYVFINRNFLS